MGVSKKRRKKYEEVKKALEISSSPDSNAYVS